MKNRPDPRWAQGPSGGHLTEITPDMWIHRSHQRVQSDVSNQLSSRSSSPTSSGTTSEAGSSHSVSSYFHASHLSAPTHSGSVYSSGSIEPSVSAQPSHIPHSQQRSTSSSLLSTPVDEYVQQPPAASNGEYDLATMLLSYQPNYATYDEFGGSKDSADGYPHLTPQPDQPYCGCAEETPTYSVLLELSVRLRKAADMMSRNPSHICGGGSCCSLHRQVAELDRYLS
ncbi:hypothetical protein NMY22_g1715 [Coprinellus aureogranulatus]|nr:hypothetical protein NMY22_g1715 [Coprinellus aureogranulatus]